MKSADASTLFRMIDTDADGSVTVDEVTAFFNKFNKRSEKNAWQFAIRVLFF